MLPDHVIKLIVNQFGLLKQETIFYQVWEGNWYLTLIIWLHCPDAEEREGARDSSAVARWSSNVNATQTQSYTPREDEAAVAERDSRKRDDFHRDFGVDSRERGEHLLEHVPGVQME